jgi:hypothetical protein
MNGANQPTPPPAMLTLYRTMKKDAQGQPRCGVTSSMLGARPQDLRPDEQGNVGPGRGGISVAPAPEKLRPQFRPLRFPGGQSKLPLFAIEEARLAPDLAYDPDQGDRASDHGEIAASRQMLTSAYQAALVASHPSWSPA